MSRNSYYLSYQTVIPILKPDVAIFFPVPRPFSLHDFTGLFDQSNRGQPPQLSFEAKMRARWYQMHENIVKVDFSLIIVNRGEPRHTERE